jgi:hypothetical protein
VNGTAGAVLAFLAGVACLSAAGGQPRRASSGSWGGTGVALEVTESGGKLDYDCAHGTISAPLVLDGDGRFDVKGLHYREHGGPVREGENGGQPVRYIGQVTGDAMTLTIRPADGGEAIGTHELTRGRAGRIRKCL